MAKQKGKTNEADVAEAGAVALEQVVSKEHGEPAAAPLVESGGGTAADEPAPEHAAEPETAAAGSGDGGSSAAEPEGEAEAVAAGVVETASDKESEGLNDGHGEVADHFDDAGSAGVAEDEGGASGGELGAEPDPDGGSDLGNGLADDGAGDDGSGAGGAGHGDDRDGDAVSSAIENGHGDDGGEQADALGHASADHGGDDGASGDASDAGADLPPGGVDPEPADVGEAPNHVEDPTLEPADSIIATAEHACWGVLDYLEEYFDIEDGERARLALLSGQLESTATNAIAACVRDIGKERARPAVIGQQLKILRLIDDPELSEKEELVVSTFISVLVSIDAHDRVVLERWRAEQAERPERQPVPIDETTMEPVDEPLATWGA